MIKSETTLELKGTASKLASLIHSNSTYEYEGYHWLKSDFKTIAKQMGVNERTIRRTVENNSKIFRYLIKKNENKGGTHLLIRVGSGTCESDHVEYLRKTWVHGLVFFNAELAKHLEFKLDHLHNIDFQSEAQRQAYAKRLKKHIDKARLGAINLDMLKAGQKISLAVKPSQMGLLRGMVKTFNTDAQDVLSCLLTLSGWQQFIAHVKSEGTAEHFYHWVNLPTILKHPHIALDTYLSVQQSEGKIDIAEANRILKKILKMQPKGA